MSKLLVLTQPWPRVERLAGQLQQAGIPSLALPFSRIETLPQRPLALQAHDWVVVISPSAAETLLAQALPHDPAAPMPRFACVGPGTVEALRERLQAQAWPVPQLHWPAQHHDAQALMAAPFWGPLQGRRVLVARAERSKTAWAEWFTGQQASVTDVALYRQVAQMPDWERALTRLRPCIEHAGFTRLTWYVSQESVVEPLVQQLGTAAIGPVLQRDLALVPHERIAAQLRRQGWTQTRLILPGASGLISAMQIRADH